MLNRYLHLLNIVVTVKYINGNVLNVGNKFEQHLYPTTFFKESEYIPRCLNCYPKYKSAR